MKGRESSFSHILRSSVPGALRRRLSLRLKARLRALLRIEPFPDLAVRHPLFKDPEYRRLRTMARAFDIEKPYRPILERGHQTSFVLARWFAAAGVKGAFHVGYANGRHIFYLTHARIVCAGTDLPADQSNWVRLPEGVLDRALVERLLLRDFFDLTRGDVQTAWANTRIEQADIMFSEATFETFLPWRREGISVPAYVASTPTDHHALMNERFPAKLVELKDSFRNMIFIEPEPEAGGAGTVFDACARRLPDLAYSVWRFKPPLDRLFRLSPHHPTHQVVYAFTRDRRLLDELGAYANQS